VCATIPEPNSAKVTGEKTSGVVTKSKRSTLASGKETIAKLPHRVSQVLQVVPHKTHRATHLTQGEEASKPKNPVHQPADELLTSAGAAAALNRRCADHFSFPPVSANEWSEQGSPSHLSGDEDENHAVGKMYGLSKEELS
jgi:hypothetical protein